MNKRDYSLRNIWRREVKNSCCSRDPEGRKSSTFWKRHCRAKIAPGSRHPIYPKLMIMVLLENECSTKRKKNKKIRFIDDVLEIKVVAFFLGHPVVQFSLHVVLYLRSLSMNHNANWALISIFEADKITAFIDIFFFFLFHYYISFVHKHDMSTSTPSLRSLLIGNKYTQRAIYQLDTNNDK